MGTQQNSIVILGIVAAIIIVLYIAFRNFKLGDLLGIEKAQEAFDKWADQTSKDFNNWASGLGDYLSGFDPNALAGKTIDASDQFGKGSTITFSDDTTVTKDGKIEGSGQELNLGEEDHKILSNFYNREQKLLATTQKVIDKNRLTQDEVDQINKTITDFHKLNVSDGVLRDSTGLVLPEFTASQLAHRATQTFLNNKSQAFRDSKTGKTEGFGGFSSAVEQEKALRKALEESRKANPEYFKKLDEVRRLGEKKTK